MTDNAEIPGGIPLAGYTLFEFDFTELRVDTFVYRAADGGDPFVQIANKKRYFVHIVFSQCSTELLNGRRGFGDQIDLINGLGGLHQIQRHFVRGIQYVRPKIVVVAELHAVSDV